MVSRAEPLSNIAGAMASENEASCESDPNFAVICGFLEKFGLTCGLANIDFVDLQEMLENTQEVSHELIELHVKLMRRARRSVSSNDRWERALIKTCHTFSSQDAWEIERFGYKKARISSKLRVLKELLEMQFDYNQKFKNEINKMSATELRTEPLGRDRMGRAYWYQSDESCQVRVYKDDPDDETWSLVAKDRNGLVSLISQLGNGDTTKSSSEPVSNEDSNSVEVEKPTLDTGQTKPTSPKPKIDSEDAADEKMEIDSECTANPIAISENTKDIAECKLDDTKLPTTEVEDEIKDAPKTQQSETETVKSKEDDDDSTKKEDVRSELNGSDDKTEVSKVEEVKSKTPEENCENALNLCSKDISSNKEEITEEKNCLDLSVKATPCLRIKPITELMPQPQHVEMQKKEFMGIKGKYIRNDSMEKGLLYPNPTHVGKAVQSASYDAICYKRAMEDDIYPAPPNLKQPRFDRPTLLGQKKYISYINEDDDEEGIEDEELEDEIEEPLMLVQGEGSGFPNESVNEDSPIVGDVIEDPVLYVSGEGNGEDCETGNKCLDESREKGSKDTDDSGTSATTQSSISEKSLSEEVFVKNVEQASKSTEDKSDTSETILDSTNNEDSDSASKTMDSPNGFPPENVSSPSRQTFFFGNSFSPSTSPMKTASLSFGASTVVDSQNATSRSVSPESILSERSRDVEASAHCFEKTDLNLIGNNPSHSKVPENVDIEHVIDNNKKKIERLSVIESEIKVSKERGQRCDKAITNISDFHAGDVCKGEVYSVGDVSLLSAAKSSTPEATNTAESNPSSESEITPSETSRERETCDEHILSTESVTTYQNPESSNSECLEEATTSDCAISNSQNDSQSDFEETSRIEEKVSSTVIEEEPTTSDESNSIVSISSGQKVANSSKSALPDSCLEDREVTGAPESETIESTDDEINTDEVTSADDVPTSTTDIKRISKENITDCASKESSVCLSMTSERINEDLEVADINTVNHNRNTKELNSVDRRCEVESTKQMFSEASSRQDANEPVTEVSKNIVNSNQMEEDNDLLCKENEVGVANNTKHVDNTSFDLNPNKVEEHKQAIRENSNLQADSKNSTTTVNAKSLNIIDKTNESNSNSSSQQSCPKKNDNKNETNMTEAERSANDTEQRENDESLHSSHTIKKTDNLKEDTKSVIDIDVEKNKSRADKNINRNRSEEDKETLISDKVDEGIEVKISGKAIKDTACSAKDLKSKNEREQSNIILESTDENVEAELNNTESPGVNEEIQIELENKDSPVVIIETDEDTCDNRSSIAAIKAIKITNVQAKCEIIEKVEDITSNKDNIIQQKPEAIGNKQNNPKEREPNPQPLRFLRGRRPNQMLSVKSYATRNKNLVLRKETKPQPIINDKSKQHSEKDIVNDPLLNIVKIEDHVENNVVRRSTRRKPGDNPDVHPAEIISIETTKKPKGRPRKNPQAVQEVKQVEEVDLRYSKRLRLSNNQNPSSIDVETIDLTAENDGRRISARNCNENIPLRGGMTIKPIYKEADKPTKKNGPFLTCVNIQKLKENPLDHVESPLSIESSGGGDNSDVVIIEDDPLAVPDPYDTAPVKSMTLNSFQLDVEPSHPTSTVVTRSLRKRGITEPEISIPTGVKRRKTKGKRQVDLELRRSIEEQKKQEISSSDEEKTKDQSPKRKPQPYKKKQETVEVLSETPTVKPIRKPRAARKKTLLGLDVPAVIEELNNATVGHVRQSRRIAQLKIKEEAERRKLEEITMTDPKESKKKSKKNVDKDYKAERRKRPKPPTEEEVTVDVPEVEEKKKKRKRKRKHKDPRKIFDESNPWRSSSGSSTSNDEVEEEEEEIAEYSEAESPLFKSDHEFSPESDIEDTGEPQPLKRARTARKEDDIEDDVDDHACQKCGKSDHPEWILLCDGCDNGWHCSCLRPALFIIPEGDWFCPPCQHNSLVKQLEEKLVEYDKRIAKREIEVRRKERLAYVGISLANVLPVKDAEEKRKKKEKSEEEQDDEESESEQSSSSESSSSSDSDEPIYQLRQRRQAHSYRFNDYDELINSAIQDEMDAVKGAGNQGRGKDISTIVNAEKEEQPENGQPELELPPPVVPVETKELPPAVVPPEHHDSDEEKIKPVKKFLGRKKQRKLNSLDVSSGDDPYSDEDFKGSSSDEEDDDDFEEDLGSDSSEAYGSRRRKGPVRRSTRARTSRYDKDFINDDTEEEEDDIPRKKKSKSTWNESDTEESDISWKWSSRRKSSRNITSKKKRSKKSKKHFDDSDGDRSKKKKRRIKYGGLNDDDEEGEPAGRRTRGKKINYADVLASDSDDEIRTRKAPPRIESDDDYVANEEEEDQENDEDYEKEESVEKEEESVAKEKSPKNKEREKSIPPPDTNNTEPESTEIKSILESQPVNVLPPEKPEIAHINPEPTPDENFDLDNLNSSIDDLPDDIVDDNDVDDELNPIDEINKNLEEMDEEEMEKLMEEEEYANKQLQLVAMQLEKEKKRKEREAKKKETVTAVDSKAAKKRTRKKPSNVVQIATLQVGPDMQSNPELSEPPGITIPIFSEIPPSTPPVEGSPKKRRGRGKGKKTLEKEAAAAAAAAAASVVATNVTPTSVPTSVMSDSLDDQLNIPTTVDTVANVNNDDMVLANAAAMHGAELAIAAPPQPFSQTQPTPSVITRMLQTQPGSGNYSPMGMGHNYYADQPPPHAENSPTPPVSNSQMATCVPVSNSMAGNQNSGQLPPISQAQHSYMHGAPGPRGIPSSVYRQPTPNVNPYQRTSPAPSIPPMRVRTPAPSIPPVYHTHHPLDPSPSGGGPINVPTSSINTPDRSSPISMPPSSDSPLSNKSDPTPPPPPYTRPQMRFSNVNTSPMTGSPIRQNQQQQPPSNLLTPQHIQQQPSPMRNNMPPYHPASVPPNYYGGYMQGGMGADDALPPSGYQYSDQFSETNSPQDIGKSYDEENSGEFGGLVSYFSSQREDDLDT